MHAVQKWAGGLRAGVWSSTPAARVGIGSRGRDQKVSCVGQGGNRVEGGNRVGQKYTTGRPRARRATQAAGVGGGRGSVAGGGARAHAASNLGTKVGGDLRAGGRARRDACSSLVRCVRCAAHATPGERTPCTPRSTLACTQSAHLRIHALLELHHAARQAVQRLPRELGELRLAVRGGGQGHHSEAEGRGRRDGLAKPLLPGQAGASRASCWSGAAAAAALRLGPDPAGSPRRGSPRRACGGRARRGSRCRPPDRSPSRLP